MKEVDKKFKLKKEKLFLSKNKMNKFSIKSKNHLKKNKDFNNFEKKFQRRYTLNNNSKNSNDFKDFGFFEKNEEKKNLKKNLDFSKSYKRFNSIQMLKKLGEKKSDHNIVNNLIDKHFKENEEGDDNSFKKKFTKSKSANTLYKKYNKFDFVPYLKTVDSETKGYQPSKLPNKDEENLKKYLEDKYYGKTENLNNNGKKFFF